ncbi:MAG TPA: adenylate/guanylate cyclase domain-containing protein [Stellaceae bacterium]|nr:adenylate/guanylate cyclase domain-containing protein [Stellaceae bacterium]
MALVASLASGNTINWGDGFFYDLSLATHGVRPGTGSEPVAVIAMDRGSLDSEELAATPRVLFGPFWAKLIDGLAEAQVKAIGFDIIFSYSANRFPALDAQYDRGFYDALARHHDRLVLARSARQPIAAPVEAAVYDLDGDAGNDEPAAIAFAELIPDSDGVQRRVSPHLRASDGHLLPTFSAALLARAQGPAMPDQVLLAPAAPLETIPTYRLIDVLRCLDQRPAAIAEAFSGKVVLVGSNLPEEDRKRTPDRFMQQPPLRLGESGECRLGRLGASHAEGGTTPGVFVHAAAVQSVLTGNLVNPVALPGRALAAVLASLCGSLVGFTMPPWLAVLAVTSLAAVCFGLAVVLLAFGFWFPVTIPVIAAIVSMVLAYFVRFLVEERRRRRVQHAFSHYLAPSIVDRLAESEAELRLGGERREITVMFADLSGFTALSTRLPPEELMAVTNIYHAMMVEAVEATGGYVNQFLGDAVMAIWGAPLPDPDHPVSAAQAALRIVEKVMRAKAEADALGVAGYAVKIGINTGPAVVGNVGAAKRYNYTAVGETVNIAARLESVPEDYGCRIVVGPATAAAIADRFVLCELDWIKVKGKDAAFSIFQLVGEKSTADSAEMRYREQYRAGLERYRAGDFTAAEDIWRRQAKQFGSGTAAPSPPLIMAGRCADLKSAPPAAWDGVFVKISK